MCERENSLNVLKERGRSTRKRGEFEQAEGVQTQYERSGVRETRGRGNRKLREANLVIHCVAGEDREIRGSPVARNEEEGDCLASV
jgi:hypothetical protein